MGGNLKPLLGDITKIAQVGISRPAVGSMRDFMRGCVPPIRCKPEHWSSRILCGVGWSNPKPPGEIDLCLSVWAAASHTKGQKGRQATFKVHCPPAPSPYW